MTLEERLQAFYDKGYHVAIQSHLLPGPAREGWPTIMWQEHIRDHGLNEPTTDSIGFAVKAVALWPDSQDIWGGVFPTVDQALQDAEKELAKYAKPFRRLEL